MSERRKQTKRMQNFTPDQLTAYLYGETDAVTSQKIEKAVQTNWTLHEKLKVIAASVNRLDKMPLLSPSEKTVENLIAYAEAKTSSLNIEL
jgi:hypothetical protein